MSSSTRDRFEAAVSDGAGGVVVRRFPVPAPRPTDVLVRSVTSGISTGTDRWVLQGSFVWRDITYPAVPGYQAAGVVEWIGEEVTRFEVGRPVAVTAGRAPMGVSSAWGTHASAILADEDDVYDAAGIPPLRAAFLVSAQVGYNAASRLALEAESRVIVVGDGIIGASAALACAARGFDVMVVGRRSQRLDALRAVGLAAHDAGEATALTIKSFDPVAVIDTAQNQAAFDSYIEALPRAAGQLVYSGHSPGGVTAWADMATLQKRELTVHFVAGMLPERLQATLGLMRSGALPVDRLVGVLAGDPDEVKMVLEDVATGALSPVAAAIDWTWAT